MRQIEDHLPEKCSEFHRVAYTDGIESVLYIRCMKHVAHPALNSEEEPGECPICAIDKLNEVHVREIRNMALDAYNEAFKAIMNSVKTAGFCSFCGIVISVHSTLIEAQAAMQTHILRCPKMHEALAQVDTATMPLEPLTTEQLEDRLQNRTKHRQG